MQFNIHLSNKAKQFLLLHGAPTALLHPTRLNLSKTFSPINIKSNQRDKAISTQQQLTWFRHLYQHLPIEPRLIVSVSNDYYQQARLTGLILFWRYLQYSLNYPEIFDNSAPIWYIPQLNFTAKTPLDAYQQGQHRAANLLVIDGIYQDMPAIKLDKVHDILQLMADRPRLLLLRSRDPYNYCLDKLGVRPNIIFNFDRQLHRRII